jgi:hypothetical protein
MFVTAVFSWAVLTDERSGLSLTITLHNLEEDANLRPMVSRPVYLGVGLPSGVHDKNFVFCLKIEGLMWGALSDERPGLSLTTNYITSKKILIYDRRSVGQSILV